MIFTVSNLVLVPEVRIREGPRMLQEPSRFSSFSLQVHTTTQHFVNPTELHDTIYGHRKQFDYSRSQRQYGVWLILGRCCIVSIRRSAGVREEPERDHRRTAPTNSFNFSFPSQ